MQFFAYNQNKIIFSEEALKGIDYRCPECGGFLRVKEGLHRRKHFFHLSHSTHCRQSTKSELHLTVQKAILTSLPEGESFLEKKFSSIGRIADVVWEPKRLIFEVQCSFISLQEVKNRMEDYASCGYRVIWILHDYRFNKRRLSAAEFYLRPDRSFFTSINQQGRGIIYDQYEVFSHHCRVKKGPPFPIDLRSPHKKVLKVREEKVEKTSCFKDIGKFLYYLALKKISK